jgi:hypothetical protein
VSKPLTLSFPIITYLLANTSKLLSPAVRLNAFQEASSLRSSVDHMDTKFRTHRRRLFGILVYCRFHHNCLSEYFLYRVENKILYMGVLRQRHYVATCLLAAGHTFREHATGIT